jgi:imidazolonepropionase-like amidohydrolase
VPTLALIAARLIDGTGRDPVENAAVIVEDGRITAAGARSAISIPADAHVIDDDDLTLLPGLMDMHVHLSTTEGIDMTRLLMTPQSLTLLHAIPQSARTLQAGVTTVRDAGFTPVGVRLASEQGFFPAPRMQLAVSILGQTGGHADDRMPCGCRLPFDSGIDIPHGVVDGADSMLRKVREVFQAGADWIKLCTSGGVLSAGDLPDSPQLTVEEIRVAVTEAASVGKRVMSHAMSAEGIKNALRAGVVSIEHGCLMDEEGMAMMRAQGAFLVPTLVAPLDVIANSEKPGGGGLPVEMVEKARNVARRHRESVTAAIASGVKIAMGTDSGVGPHGGNLRELAEMVRCGMTPMQAIEASSRVCAELLRREGDIGTLEKGKLADVVAVAGDPLADVGILSVPERIRAVVKGGEVVRDLRARVAVG